MAHLISTPVFAGAAGAMLAFLPLFANELRLTAIPVTACQK
jgi:hypothetical protein